MIGCASHLSLCGPVMDRRCVQGAPHLWPNRKQQAKKNKNKNGWIVLLKKKKKVSTVSAYHCLPENFRKPYNFEIRCNSFLFMK